MSQAADQPSKSQAVSTLQGTVSTTVPAETTGEVSHQTCPLPAVSTTTVTSVTDNRGITSSSGSSSVPPVSSSVTAVLCMSPVNIYIYIYIYIMVLIYVSGLPSVAEQHPTTGAVIPVTSMVSLTSGAHEGLQPVNLFAKNLFDSSKPGSDNRTAEQSEKEPQISSTTADVEGDEMADIEQDMSKTVTKT